MNIITQIRVLRETYSPVIAVRPSKEEGERDWDFKSRIYSAEKEPNFELPNKPLPRGHVLKINDAENVFIRGNVGIGKTTFLLAIYDSLESYKTFLSTGRSSYTEGGKNNLLFSEWQRKNDKDLFNQFKDHSLIQTVYSSVMQSIPFSEKREKELIARIMRNSMEHKGSQSEAKTSIANYSKKIKMNYSEFLEKYCFFVEAGIYITRHNSPETMFGNYELIFNDKVNPEKINAQYLNFYNLPGKGLSQGQKTMHALEKMNENSSDLSLILLDEPTNSLPESEIEKVAKLISTAKGQKFIVTHNDKLVASNYFPSGVGKNQIHYLNENQMV